MPRELCRYAERRALRGCAADTPSAACYAPSAVLRAATMMPAPLMRQPRIQTDERDDAAVIAR